MASPAIVEKVDIIVYPFGEDCAGEWFSTNTKFNLKVGKPVIYKHGVTKYKGVIAEVLDYRMSEEGVIATLGLYETPVLGSIQEGYRKGALFASSGSVEGSYKISPDGEILEWNDFEITLIDVVSSGSLVPCNFRARALNMSKMKCNCSGAGSLLMEVPSELVETIGEIMEENKLEEEVIDDSIEDSIDDDSDNAKKSADEADPEVKEETSVFARRAAAVKMKSAEHKDVDDYLATLVAEEIISATEVPAHKNVLVSLKSAKNEEAIETYMDTLEKVSALGANGNGVKAAIHKKSADKKKSAPSTYEADVKKLAEALENYNAYAG